MEGDDEGPHERTKECNFYIKDTVLVHLKCRIKAKMVGDRNADGAPYILVTEMK